MIEHCRRAWQNSIQALRALALIWNGRNGVRAERLRREANGMDAELKRDEQVKGELASIQEVIDAKRATIRRLQAQIKVVRVDIAEQRARYLAITEGRERDRRKGHSRGPRKYGTRVES